MKLAWWVLSLAGAAWGQESELDKLKKKAEQDSLPERVGKLEKQQVTFNFEDGLRFQSADGNFTGHVGGRVLTHFRWTENVPTEASRASSDSFFVREGRIEVEGTFMKDFEFKVQADFATSNVTNGSFLIDAFLGWKPSPFFNLRVGQIEKPPFGQEECTSLRFTEFNERSEITRLCPGRDLGILIYGKFFDGILGYEIGAFNGGQVNAVLDTNDEKDLDARIRISPFVKSDIAILKGLRLGIAGTIGVNDNNSIDQLDFTTTGLAVKFMDAGGGTNFVDGRRWRLGLELTWLYGPFQFRAEYARRSDQVDTATEQDEEVATQAWEVQVSCLLTGEDKPLESRIKPKTPFNLEEGHWGAVELAFRVARIIMDDKMFDLGLASESKDADSALCLAFGVNWWLLKNVRISPNFLYEKYGNGVLFGNGEEKDYAWGMVWRFQIDF